jgi:hypothetical protein
VYGMVVFAFGPLKVLGELAPRKEGVVEDQLGRDGVTNLSLRF